jgi:hypothetical protein
VLDNLVRQWRHPAARLALRQRALLNAGGGEGRRNVGLGSTYATTAEHCDPLLQSPDVMSAKGEIVQQITALARWLGGIFAMAGRF